MIPPTAEGEDEPPPPIATRPDKTKSIVSGVQTWFNTVCPRYNGPHYKSDSVIAQSILATKMLAAGGKIVELYLHL